MSRTRLTLALILALTAHAAACDGDVGPGFDAFVDASCVVAAINTDYVSTSVSLLRADGSLCAPAVITSGSRPPGVTTALSGDVVLPTEPSPDGLLVLIDRYPAAVLTLVTPESGEVVRQLGVGTGYPSNPHDVLFVAPDRAWVTRYDRNPTPTATPDDLDDGGDVLVIDPATGALVERIDLAPWASPGMEPRPDRLGWAGDKVWVTLGNLAPRFNDGGPGVVVALDPATGAFAGRTELAGLASCGGTLAVPPGGGGAWVSCTGVFQRGDTPQLEASGVVWVARDADGAPVEGFRVQAGDVGPGRPFGHPLLALTSDRAVVVVLGTLDGEPDALWLVDRGAGTVTPLGVETDAYSLGALLRADAGGLLVADANRQHPKLRRFTLADGSLTEAAAVITDPVIGLEPRSLARFR
ncbi:MAG: hypothetical protein CVU56_21015 [Deltaproteobacteria bacterium HGW-Deltaproteobacteria-14]|jgi:hypothetical protein|nr:MAG: hypothetical protein CVU56_21015 [Deltaproteobacteria bacterium HGW-Deltaproteobacteria-14]